MSKLLLQVHTCQRVVCILTCALCGHQRAPERFSINRECRGHELPIASSYYSIHFPPQCQIG